MWIAYDRNRKQVVDFELGGRDTRTAQRLWQRLNVEKIHIYATDYYPVYEKLIPPERHLQTKAETYTIEGFNSQIRHFLARFRRKSKCYSKAQHMVDASLALFFWGKDIFM